jgi:hypothetical protein
MDINLFVPNEYAKLKEKMNKEKDKGREECNRFYSFLELRESHGTCQKRN